MSRFDQLASEIRLADLRRFESQRPERITFLLELIGAVVVGFILSMVWIWTR